MKGTLPYPKPTPSENPRRKLKKPKNSKPPYPRRLDEGCLVGKNREKKICGFGQSRIPAETASRSFRKLDDSFKKNSYCTEDDSQSRNKNHDACAKKLNEEYELTEKAKTKAVELVKQATEKLKQSLKQ